MQLKIVLAGAVLLLAGTLAYSMVPNVHRTAVSKMMPVLGPLDSVKVDGAVEYVRNIVLQNGSNELHANFTLVAQHGDLYPLRLQLYAKNASTCAAAPPKVFLFDKDVINNTIVKIPLTASGVYCIVFNNEANSDASFPMPKTVSGVVTLYSNSEQTSTTNDGSVNLTGVGLGAIGVLVSLYGLSRKTVIPWD